MGIAVAGLPNLFLISGPGSPIGSSNAIPTIENNVDFIADLIMAADTKGARYVQASAPSQASWAEKVAANAGRTLYMKTRSWYNGSNIPGKSPEFMIYLGRFPDYNRAGETERLEDYPDFEFA